MDKPFIYIPIENYSSSPFGIVPPENYIQPLNKETGEQFPFCCNFHLSIYEFVKKDVPNFLIDQVKNAGQIKNESWFDSKYFDSLPLKVTTQITYTEDHISNRIETDDWFDDICEYIDYNVESFGQPSYGLGTYLGNLPIILENITPKIPVHKKQRLIEFIESYFKKSNPDNQASKTDLNILYSKYQEWLKIFPFELETYFGNLKQHFEKQLPFINGQTKENRYSGKCTADLHTKNSLIEALKNLTNSLLTQINGLVLYENGLITDINKIKLELILNNRKLELKQGYKNSSPNEEQRYRKMLKKWFNDEKKFFEEITPLLKTGIPVKSEKIIAPFYTHLNHSLPEQLAEICKTIFNRNSSPKDYAIMLCLLSESGNVLIPNRKRTDFYLSWYSFIDEPFPTNNNFHAINKNIVDKSVSGFVFHDEADQDYCHLRSTFEQALKSIK